MHYVVPEHQFRPLETTDRQGYGIVLTISQKLESLSKAALAGVIKSSLQRPLSTHLFGSPEMSAGVVALIVLSSLGTHFPVYRRSCKSLQFLCILQVLPSPSSDSLAGESRT